MKRLIILILSVLSAACNGKRMTYDASGTFEATEVIVSSESNGRIIRLDLEEGERLTAGTVIGAIDSVQLYLKKLQLEKSIGATRSRTSDVAKQIAATQEQILTQQREKRRVENLLQSHAATTKQLDDINALIALFEKQLAAQQSTLENNNRGISAESSALEIQVAQIEDQLSKCIIKSPIDGTVLVKYAEAGEVTASGKPLFKIADTDHMKLRAYITSGQLTELKIGEKVQLFADAGEQGSRTYEGQVIWISDKAEFTPKTIQTRDERANLVYAVKIAVANDGLLKIGMYADIKFGE